MTKETDESELVLNLWAYLDQGMGLVYAVAGKVYALTGSEEEKLALLHQLAPTDYISVKRQSLPKNFRLRDGQRTQEGLVAASTLRGNVAQIFEKVIKTIETELPPIPNFQADQYTPQRIPQHYLSCLTFLLEDDVGKVTPITSREQSHQLFIERQKRELMATLGIPENEAEEFARHMAQEQAHELGD